MYNKNVSSLLQKLYTKRARLRSKTSLDFILQAFQILHNPYQKFPSVHITGTNGKGSVAMKIAKVLSASGYKTALFTSPHIGVFQERIKIDGKNITSYELQKRLQKIFSMEEKYCLSLTFFEIVTLLAFWYFADQKVDIAVIEAGIGGHYDPTNVIIPIVSIITSIGYDHTQILGNSLQDIAKEKAYIIKKYVPIVLGPSAIQKEILSFAKKQNSEVIQIKENYAFFDDENQEIAKKTLQVIAKKYPLKQQAMQYLKKRPCCRYEKHKVMHTPVIFDVAHNPLGFTKLFTQLKKDFPAFTIHMVLAISKDKDLAKIFAVMPKENLRFYLFESSHDRLYPCKHLQQVIEKLQFSHVYVFSSLQNAIIQALQDAKDKKAILLVTGSFYIMKEAKKKIKKAALEKKAAL